MAGLQRRILEEMVLERLLAAIDPDAIVALGQELDRSLERAVDPQDDAGRDPGHVKGLLVRRALERLDAILCDLAMTEPPLV